MNIEQLKAEVKAAQEANVLRINEATQVAMLEATLQLEGSEALFDAKVKLAVTSNHTKVLQALVDECAAIVDSITVMNTKTRTTRVWAGSRRFAFGTQINLMYQLATGILYSCAEHKQLLLAHTGLDSELLEQVVEAFGSPSYFSRNFGTIVEAKPYDIEKVLSAVSVMQSELNVVVDTSLLITSVFSLEFGKSSIVAELAKIKSDEAIAEADLDLQV